jgi:hypothetical protein
LRIYSTMIKGSIQGDWDASSIQAKVSYQIFNEGTL